MPPVKALLQISSFSFLFHLSNNATHTALAGALGRQSHMVSKCRLWGRAVRFQTLVPQFTSCMTSVKSLYLLCFQFCICNWI